VTEIACQIWPHLLQRTLRPSDGNTAAISYRVSQAGQIMSVMTKPKMGGAPVVAGGPHAIAQFH